MYFATMVLWNVLLSLNIKLENTMFKTLVTILSLSLASVASAFTVDVGQTPGPVSGHWWNAPAYSQPGWGMAVQQQYETIFMQLYTYKADGSPIWYIASCKLENNLCTAKLYTATGGSPLPYYTPVTETVTGVVTLTFTSNDTATFSYKIGDGVAWASQIEKYIFDNTKP